MTTESFAGCPAEQGPQTTDQVLSDAMLTQIVGGAPQGTVTFFVDGVTLSHASIFPGFRGGVRVAAGDVVE